MLRGLGMRSSRSLSSTYTCAEELWVEIAFCVVGAIHFPERANITQLSSALIFSLPLGTLMPPFSVRLVAVFYYLGVNRVIEFVSFDSKL